MRFGLLLPVLLVACRPERVDLRADQSAGLPATRDVAATVRNQGARGTCTTFAAIAALEAEYRRAGYGELDLSEHMLNHFGKSNWLHFYWEPWDLDGDGTIADTNGDGTPDEGGIARLGAEGAESQSALFSGGGSAGWLFDMGHGYRVVPESAAPYLDGSPYTDGALPPHTDPYWRSQRNTDDFNLAHRYLPDLSREAPLTYGVARATGLCDNLGWVASRPCRDLQPDDFLRVLRLGHPIAIDTSLSIGDGEVWEPGPNVVGDHALLLVGFDMGKGAEPYLIVKNSWGPVTASPACDEAGYTCARFSLLSQVYAAGYIEEVREPAPWPALGLFGRFNGDLGEGAAELDVYHLPGSFQHVFDRARETGTIGREFDRRAGVLWQADAGFRVNGTFERGFATLSWEPTEPNLRWGDESSSHQLQLALLPRLGPRPAVLTGTASVGGGRPTAAFGVRGGNSSTAADSVRPLRPESWTGTFELRLGPSTVRTLEVLGYDDSGLSPTERAVTQGFGATLTFAGVSVRSQLRVSKPRPNEATLKVPPPDRLDAPAAEWVTVWLYHSGSTGVLTGAGAPGTLAEPFGVYARRQGDSFGVNIVSPARGARLPYGLPVTLRADSPLAVRFAWKIVRTDGSEFSLGVGNPVSRNFDQGNINLVVEATTDAGQLATDHIVFDSINAPPVLTVIEPTQDAGFCIGQPVRLRATVVDLNYPPTYQLPDESLISWSEGGGAPFATGYAATRTFPLGVHQVTARATDGSLAVTVTSGFDVHTCSSNPPVATITGPAADVVGEQPGYVLSGFDATRMQWYLDVPLAGDGTDIEDGALPAARLVWTTSRTDLQAAALGNGRTLTARLYSTDCTGSTHVVRLTVTDSSGNVTVETRMIHVWQLC